VDSESTKMINTDDKSTEKNITINQSSEKKSSSIQFLKLAKEFALDGAMLPVEKQMPLEDRSAKRIRISTLRKQNNIEAIIKKTLAYCAHNDISQNTDHDWFSRYIHLAEDVSNNTMQDLWAKILSGELHQMGTYSLKALKVLKDMSIVDAKLLAKACSLSVKDQKKENIRLISGTYQQPGLLNFFNKESSQHISLNDFGLNFADLQSLADNHLIHLQGSESNMMSNDSILNFNYNGLPLKLRCNKANISIKFYKFTAIGAELANLISDNPNNDYFTILKQKLSYFFDINA